MAVGETEFAALKEELAEIRHQLSRFRIPGPIVDPAPWMRGPVVDPAPWPGGPVTDPVPWDPRPHFWDWWRPRWPIPIPRPGDPAPFDAARFRVALGLDLREVAGRILGVNPAKLKMSEVKALHVGDVVGIEPGPVVDPAPDDVGRWVRIDPRLIRFPWPGDPAPYDMGRFRPVRNVRLIDAVAKIRGTSASQVSINDLARISVRDLIDRLVDGPQGPEVDPAPLDYARYASMMRSRATALDLNVREISAMDTSELQAAEHHINAEITRLESLRDLVKKRAKAKR